MTEMTHNTTRNMTQPHYTEVAQGVAHNVDVVHFGAGHLHEPDTSLTHGTTHDDNDTI